VKAFDPAHPATRERLAAEARAARVQHPNVCVVHDFGEQNGMPYLVFDRLVGESLAARLAYAPVPLDVACEMIAQLLSALDAVHESGLVHGDVKPQNVFLAQRLGCAPILKLVDFGSCVTSSRSGPYTAPEWSRPEIIDGRADVHSVGVLLGEVLRGRGSQELLEVVAHATAGDRRRRYEGAHAMQRALMTAFGRPERDTAPMSATYADSTTRTRVYERPASSPPPPRSGVVPAPRFPLDDAMTPTLLRPDSLRTNLGRK
jgi:serine/threonine protein kinase